MRVQHDRQPFLDVLHADPDDGAFDVFDDGLVADVGIYELQKVCRNVRVLVEFIAEAFERRACAQELDDFKDGGRCRVDLLACYDFGLCKIESLEVIVAEVLATFVCWFIFDFFGEQLDVSCLEELRCFRDILGRVIDQVHLDVGDVFKQRFEAADIFVAHDKVIERKLETERLVALNGPDEIFVYSDVFKNLEDETVGVQKPEQVVEKNLAAAVDERLAFTDEARKPDAVQDVLEHLGGRLQVASNYCGIAAWRVSE